jgi:hypothetical protein
VSQRATDAVVGTPEAPLRTFGAALEASDGGDAIVLAAGDYTGVLTTGVYVDVYGGFDPSTWQRIPGARSRLVPPSPCDEDLFTDGARVVSGVTFATGAILDDTVLLDSELECVAFIGGRSLVRGVEATAGQIFLNEVSAGTRVLDSHVGSLVVERPDIQLLRTTVDEQVIVTAGASITFVNSVLRVVGGGDMITCDDCAAVRVFASNVLGDDADRVINALGTAASEVVIAASAVRMKAGAVILDIGATDVMTFDGNAVELANGVMRRRTGAVDIPSTPNANSRIDTCDGVDCVYCAIGPLAFDASGAHVSPATTVTRSVAGSLAALDPPTTVAGDVDGQCRFFVDGAPDAGADEP